MLTTTIAVLGLFVLRIGIPLAIMFAVGEALRRCDGRRGRTHGLAA